MFHARLREGWVSNQQGKIKLVAMNYYLSLSQELAECDNYQNHNLCFCSNHVT